MKHVSNATIQKIRDLSTYDDLPRRTPFVDAKSETICRELLWCLCSDVGPISNEHHIRKGILEALRDVWIDFRWCRKEEQTGQKMLLE